MRRLVETVRRDWPRLTLELVVIVVGITLSFALNEWRIRSGEAEAERRLVRDLEANLAADSAALAVGIARLDTMTGAYVRLLGADATSLPADSIDRYMDWLITYVKFTPHDVAYREMQQTGTTRLLSDRALLERLIGLHSRAYVRVSEWDAINAGLVLDRTIPYLDANAPFVPDPGGATLANQVPVLAALHERDHFLNLVKTNRLLKTAQRSVYEATLVEIDSLRAILEKSR